MPIDLSGKLAIITGATSQLGRTMVRTLARAGADVVIHCYRNTSQAERLFGEIRDMGRRGMIVQADVADPEAVRSMRDTVQCEIGDPHIVIANAVGQFQWKHVLDQEIEAYENQYRTSVLHNVLMAQNFVPSMVDKGWGRYIGINTECSMQAWENQSAYISGKRGMDGVLRVLAKEVGPRNITVNQVAPGWTLSEDRPETEESLGYRERVPLRRRGTDQEIANAVLFLASDLASFISGVYLPVCGGNVMPTI
ncbi:SDR family oxidoreductase [bacterium]|nr:SDR family oxidoreductase [bacterium]